MFLRGITMPGPATLFSGIQDDGDIEIGGCLSLMLPLRAVCKGKLYYIFIFNFILICARIFTCGWFSWLADFGGESCEGKFKDFANLTLHCLSQAQTLESHYYGHCEHCWPKERFSVNFTHPQCNHFFFRGHEDVFSDAQTNRGWLCFGRFLDEKKYKDGFSSEVEFVTPVTPGGSVKFLPVV